MKRQNLKMYLLIAGLVLAAVAIFGIAKLVDVNHVGGGNPIEDIKTVNSALRIEYSIFAQEQQLILEPAKEYIEKNGSVTLQSLKDSYRYNVDRMDIGLPVNIAYEIKGMPDGCEVSSAKLEVSEDAQYTAPRRFTMEGTRCSADVYLLKTNTQYHFRITLELSNGAQAGVQGTFKTANTPRVLSIDGVPDVRDIGGWTTADGSTVRQGLIYRGGEMDGAVQADYKITQTGIDHMLHVLKVRTQMDLRDPAVNGGAASPLGNAVNHAYYHAPKYAEVFNRENFPAVRRVFAQLTNADHYPIYIHDTSGMDQTGTICYLLEAVLGVNEDDLKRDYRISTLCHGGVHGSEMDAFLEQFDKLSGDTAQEKAEGYLRSIGITDDEIASIRAILLEPAAQTE